MRTRTDRSILSKNTTTNSPLTISTPRPFWVGLLSCLGAGLLGQPPAAAQATGQPPAGWPLVLAEEFNTPGDSSVLAAHWRFAYPWGAAPGGLEAEYYTGKEVNVRGGELLLTAHRLPQPRAYPRGQEQLQLRYTSGMLYGRHPPPDSLRPAACPPGEGLSYGWFELRCRQPRSAAAFPAFWLYGAPDELDVMESGQNTISNNVHLNSHEYWRQGPVEESECQCYYDWPGPQPLAATYHRYALEWLPYQLTFYFDGVPIRRETRFLPLGCQQAVIANLAEWAWASAQTDTLAIDYLRVYRPRRLPPVPFGTPGFGQPQPAFLRFPRLQAPELTNPAGRQTWELVLPEAGGLRVALRDNFNPVCSSHLPLPLGPDWQAPWQLGWRATPVALQVPAGPAVHWAVLDGRGQQRRQGECAPGLWEPPLADLPPGAYQLRLRAGLRVGYQALYVVARPLNAQPSAEWLRPLPAPEL